MPAHGGPLSSRVSENRAPLHPSGRHGSPLAQGLPSGPQDP